MCLSQPVSYVCNSAAANLEWVILDTNNVRFGTGVLYSESAHDVGDTDSIGGQFNTILTVDGSSLVSSITFTATLNISNYIVQCGPVGSAPVNCSIVISGKINTITMPIITCLQLFQLLQLFLLIILPSLVMLLHSHGPQHQVVLVSLITVSMLLVLTTLSVLLILV